MILIISLKPAWHSLPKATLLVGDPERGMQDCSSWELVDVAWSHSLETGLWLQFRLLLLSPSFLALKHRVLWATGYQPASRYQPGMCSWLSEELFLFPLLQRGGLSVSSSNKVVWVLLRNRAPDKHWEYAQSHVCLQQWLRRGPHEHFWTAVSAGSGMPCAKGEEGRNRKALVQSQPCLQLVCHLPSAARREPGNGYGRSQ